jgi:hypothetical protein
MAPKGTVSFAEKPANTPILCPPLQAPETYYLDGMLAEIKKSLANHSSD